MLFSVELQGIIGFQTFIKERYWVGRRDRSKLSEMTPAVVLAGELAQAAAEAIAQLGELVDYIKSVELFFEPSKLTESFSPRFTVTVTVPHSTQTLEVHGPSTTKWHGALSSGPFPGSDFIEGMVQDVRLGLHRYINEIRANLSQLDHALAVPEQVEVV